MTFVQGIVRPERAWLCTDKRLSSPDRKYIDDKNIKILVIHCSDGTLLVGYTGIAILKDNTKIPDWIRTTVRGEKRTMSDTITHFISRVDRDISNQGHLLFLIVSCSQKSIDLYQITNLENNPLSWSVPPRKNFFIHKIDFPKPFYFAAGSGSSVLTKDEIKRLQAIIQNKPREPKNFTNLLFIVNERVAKQEASTVSKSAVAATLVLGGKPVDMSAYKVDETILKHTPMIIEGIDMTDLLEYTYNQFEKASKNDSEKFDDDYSEQIEIISKKSVIPRR